MKHEVRSTKHETNSESGIQNPKHLIFGIFDLDIASDFGNGGFGLIEVVVVSALVVTALVGFAQAGATAVRLLHSEQNNLEATLLAREALEAVRSVRDESWAGNIAWRTQSPLASPSFWYYPTVVNGKWLLATTSPGLISGTYNQYVFFERVGRDSSDRIVSSGGTNDAGTRKVTAVVSGASQLVVLTAYITDFQSYLPKFTEKKVIAFDDLGMTNNNLASFPSDNAGLGDPAQGFTVGASPLAVSRLELLMSRGTSAPSPVYAELRAGPTGVVVGTSQVVVSATLPLGAPAWTTFQFPDVVSLASGAKYYIRLRSIPSSTDAGSGSAGTIYWNYLQTPSSPYAGGEARRYVGQFSDVSDAGKPLDEYDFGFRVYAIQ